MNEPRPRRRSVLPTYPILKINTDRLQWRRESRDRGKGGKRGRDSLTTSFFKWDVFTVWPNGSLVTPDQLLLFSSKAQKELQVQIHQKHACYRRLPLSATSNTSSFDLSSIMFGTNNGDDTRQVHHGYLRRSTIA